MFEIKCEHLITGMMGGFEPTVSARIGAATFHLVYIIYYLFPTFRGFGFQLHSNEPGIECNSVNNAEILLTVGVGYINDCVPPVGFEPTTY